MIARSSTHTHTHTHTIGAVKRKGFTIIQLVIGMLIFAILTGIAFFGISVYTAQANETRVASDLGTFEVAIKDYMLNNPGACSDGTLNPVGLNHYLTKENTLALDEVDPNKDDLGTEISVAAGVKSEAAYKKLSVLEDPWGHQYRVVIRNNADRTTEDGEYGAKGTDRAFIYVYSMGKDGKGASNDTKQDDSVLCVQYSDGEVYSRSYLPSDGKNQAIAAPAYTYWNKDENGKHSVMKDSIFAVGGVDPDKAPEKENTSSGGTTGAGADEDQGGQAALTINPGGMKVYINVEPGTTWRQFLTGIKPTPENFFTGKEADFDSERDHVGDQVGMALNNVLNAAAKARGYSKYEDLLDVFTYESKNSSEPFQNLAEAIVWCMTVATYESACSDADGYLACEFALLGGEISEAMASPASSARRAYVQLVGNGSGSGPVRIDDKIKAGALYTLYGSDDLSTLDSQTGYENFSLTMEDGTLGPYTLFNTLFSDASYCARKGASFNSNVYNIFDGITKTIFMRLAHQEYNNFITMETTSDGVVVRLTPAGAHALTILLGKQSTDVQNMVDAGSELTGMEIYIKKTGNNSGTITRVSTHLRTSAIQQSKFEEMKQGFETGEDANKVSDVFGSIDNYLLALLNATLFAEDIDENDPTFPTDGKEQIKWIKAFFADSTLELVENSAVYRKLEWT